MPVQPVALARQPILDRREALVAYELLFRHVGGRAEDGMGATAQVLMTTLSDIGLRGVIGGRLGFVNVEAGFLCSEYVQLLPPDRVVLELLEDIEVSPRTIARCEELAELGYRFALDDYDGRRAATEALLPLASFVKVDLTLVPDAELGAMVARLRRPGLRLLAEKVETADMYARCHELGFDLFQGYFFARPQTLERRRVSPAQAAVLRIYRLVRQDADTAVLEEELKRQPTLAVALLRLVNAAAYGGTSRVVSVRQAIVRLGRGRLGVWLQMLLYLSTGPGSASLLMQVATVRARLMESMATRLRPGVSAWHDAAFMVGLLSLMEPLLGVPAEGVLDELGADEETRAAVLRREGLLGAMLELAMAVERDDPVAYAAAHARIPQCDSDGLVQLQVAAATWANQVTDTLSKVA